MNRKPYIDEESSFRSVVVKSLFDLVSVEILKDEEYEGNKSSLCRVSDEGEGQRTGPSSKVRAN